MNRLNCGIENRNGESFCSTRECCDLMTEKPIPKCDAIKYGSHFPDFADGVLLLDKNYYRQYEL